MSLITLLTKTSPSFNAGNGQVAMQFDAVLENTLEASVTLSDYPIEVGSRSNDHRVKNPIRWSLIGAVSNNPMRIQATDFTGILTELDANNGVFAASAGLMAGWLSGSDETRSSEALQQLLTLMYEGDPFSIDAGDIQLNNMVIESIRRTRDPSNENGLLFNAELVEWQDISTAISAGRNATNPTSGTSDASASATLVKKGQQAVQDVGEAINATINGWFE